VFLVIRFPEEIISHGKMTVDVTVRMEIAMVLNRLDVNFGQRLKV